MHWSREPVDRDDVTYGSIVKPIGAFGIYLFVDSNIYYRLDTPYVRKEKTALADTHIFYVYEFDIKSPSHAPFTCAMNILRDIVTDE